MVGDRPGLYPRSRGVRAGHDAAHAQGHRVPAQHRRGVGGRHRRGQPGEDRARHRPMPDGQAPGRRRAGRRLARVRAAAGARVGADGAPAERERRPDDDLFHLGHHRLSEDGAPHTRLLSHRPRHHGEVLARQHAGRSPLDDLRHRLGAGGVDVSLRAVEHGRRDLRLGRARQAVRGRGDAHDVRALPDHDLLRSPDGLPHARPGAVEKVHLPRAPSLPRRGRGGEPRGHRRVEGGHGAPHPRGLRPDRDRARGRHVSSDAVEAGLDGPGRPGPSARDRRRGRPGAAPRHRGGHRDCRPAGAPGRHVQ